MNMKLTQCPEEGCDAHSEVVDEQMWPSTHGGVIMAKVIGVCGHVFVMPAWQLDLNEVFVLDEETGELIPLS